MPTKQTLESGTEMVRGSNKANGHFLDGERHEDDPFPKRLTATEKRNTPALTSAERKQWWAALKVIEKGWKAFVEVGVALEKIRSSRLYREEYESWEAFCRNVVGSSKTEADRQINDAKVVGDLKTPNGVTGGEGVQPPSKRSQVRALATLKKPEERREAWSKALERAERDGKKVTADMVTEAVGVIRGGANSIPAGPHPDGGEPVSNGGTPAAAMDVNEWLRSVQVGCVGGWEDAELGDGSKLPGIICPDGAIPAEDVRRRFDELTRSLGGMKLGSDHVAIVQRLLLVFCAAVNAQLAADPDEKLRKGIRCLLRQYLKDIPVVMPKGQSPRPQR